MCTNRGGFRERVVGATGSAATGAQQAEVGSIGIPAASDLGATIGRVSAGTGNNAAPWGFSQITLEDSEALKPALRVPGPQVLRAAPPPRTLQAHLNSGSTRLEQCAFRPIGVKAKNRAGLAWFRSTSKLEVRGQTEEGHDFTPLWNPSRARPLEGQLRL